MITLVDDAEFVLVTASGAIDARVASCLRSDADRLPPTIVLAPWHLSVTPLPNDVSLLVPGAGDSRLRVTGLSVEDFDRLPADGHGTPAVDVWLASADHRLAVLTRALRWRRER